MNILKALLPFFIVLPGCVKKKEVLSSDLPVTRQVLDLPNDEELEEDSSLPECGEKDE